MKPVAFDYARPAGIDEAVALLAANPDAKVLAGGQTLGPMLNLRLAQPALLIDITRIAELAAVREEANAIVLGATVTHASVEDGRVPDPTHGFMPRVARGIAYRAVLSRGTIGGSLAHADPAADWLSCLTALGAEVLVHGAQGARSVALAGFMRGAMETELAHDELVVGIRIPKFSKAARFGYHKICRKSGEFAEAIGVVVDDPERAFFRAVVGATTGPPLIPEMSVADFKAISVGNPEAILKAAHYTGDAYELKIHAVALKRAYQEAYAT
jgi:carbon-monoxide dehydrogenase medium subunit